MSSIYNTTGKVVGETPSSGNAGKAANPKLEVLDALQLLLDLVGMVPGAGAIPDLLNGCISLARGDFFGAALSVFSAIPAAGDVVGAGKIIKNGEKYVEALKLVESKVLPKLPANVAKPLKEFIDKAKDKLDELMGKGKTAEKAPDAPNEKPKTGEGDEAAKKGDTQVKSTRKPHQPDRKKWEEKGGKVTDHPDGSRTYTDKNNNSVTYGKDGYPDFSPHSAVDVKVDNLSGKYGPDAKLANDAAGLSRTPDGYVWHHVQDGKTMQLVPQSVHNNFPHSGGSSVIRNGK
jgi:hypothetical protein